MRFGLAEAPAVQGAAVELSDEQKKALDDLDKALLTM